MQLRYNSIDDMEANIALSILWTP